MSAFPRHMSFCPYLTDGHTVLAILFCNDQLPWSLGVWGRGEVTWGKCWHVKLCQVHCRAHCRVIAFHDNQHEYSCTMSGFQKTIYTIVQWHFVMTFSFHLVALESSFRNMNAGRFDASDFFSVLVIWKLMRTQKHIGKVLKHHGCFLVHVDFQWIFWLHKKPMRLHSVPRTWLA